MGFLDHSTNNIILDAVLTDTGRKFLSRNDGSFSITKFALGDDEVDYGVIKKYGRTVGKEKVEKNTPIFEALTNGDQALKYKLISLSNPSILRLPSLSLSGEGVAGSIVTMGRTSNTTRSITLTQEIDNEDSIDVELRNQAFIVTMSNLFLQVQGQSPDNIDFNNMATYLLLRDEAVTSIGGSKLTMTLEVKSLTDNHFTIYGGSDSKISTFVKATGVQDGSVYDFEVQISS
mgnify:CR=1 FL=1|tara:strand:- start:17837 stop:18532 length:696 start_codon:yes stop_codon:yes gene_type:complete